jgi:nitroreductase
MNVFEAIKRRRSIRKFKKDPIPEEKLKLLFEAARLAPSAGNRQPWRFILVTESEMKNRLAKLADNQEFVADAPVIFAVFGDPMDSPGGYQRNPMMAYKQDPMIAVEHICLEAVELGLGTCWIGPASPRYDVEGIKTLLKVPERMYLICLLPVGNPMESPKPRKRKPNSEIFFKEKYFLKPGP